jgi:hypothetical protein
MLLNCYIAHLLVQLLLAQHCAHVVGELDVQRVLTARLCGIKRNLHSNTLQYKTCKSPLNQECKTPSGMGLMLCKLDHMV